MDKTENEKVKAQSKSQLADVYGVSLVTFNKWIEPFIDKIGTYRGKCYSPKQVSIIYDVIGEP